MDNNVLKNFFQRNSIPRIIYKTLQCVVKHCRNLVIVYFILSKKTSDFFRIYTDSISRMSAGSVYESQTYNDFNRLTGNHCRLSIKSCNEFLIYPRLESGMKAREIVDQQILVYSI